MKHIRSKTHSKNGWDVAGGHRGHQRGSLARQGQSEVEKNDGNRFPSFR